MKKVESIQCEREKTVLSTEKSLLLNTECCIGLDSTADILGILGYPELSKQAQRNVLFLPSMYIFHEVDDIL